MSILSILKKIFFASKSVGETGLIESPIDFRDVNLGMIKKHYSKLPEDYNTPYELEPTDQENTPHCVGHASAYLKAEKERREKNFIDFDPDWIYKECKKIDGLPANTRGTYFRSGLKVLKNVGAMPVEKGDYSKYRIGGYAKLENITFESIKQSIYEHGILLAGFKGSNLGWKNEYIRPPKKGEKIWGHAVALVGFTEKHIIFQNSWGKWGFNSYGYFPKTYLPFEVWCVLTDLPNNWSELVPDKEHKPKHTFDENLRVGMNNEEVVALQNCLKHLGCFDSGVISSGYFGEITLDAVILFQKRYNINPPYGYVGPLTRTKLNELFNQ